MQQQVFQGLGFKTSGSILHKEFLVKRNKNIEITILTVVEEQSTLLSILYSFGIVKKWHHGLKGKSVDNFVKIVLIPYYIKSVTMGEGFVTSKSFKHSLLSFMTDRVTAFVKNEL
jgi:hypothetical protein